MNKSIVFAILLVAHCSYGQMGVHPESAAAPARKFGGLAAAGSPTDAKARKEKRATPPPSTPTGTVLSPVQEKRATPKNSPKALQPIQLNVSGVGNERFNVKAHSELVAPIKPVLVREDEDIESAAVACPIPIQPSQLNEIPAQPNVVAPVLIPGSPTTHMHGNHHRAVSADQLAIPNHNKSQGSLQPAQSYVYAGHSQEENAVAPVAGTTGNIQQVSKIHPASQHFQPIADDAQLNQAVEKIVGEGYLDMQNDTNQSDLSLVRNKKDKIDQEIENEILKIKCIQLLKNPSRDIQIAMQENAKIRKKEVSAQEIIKEVYRRGYFRINRNYPADSTWNDILNNEAKKKDLDFNQKLNIEEAVEKAIKRLRKPSEAVASEARKISADLSEQAERIKGHTRNPKAEHEAREYLKMSEAQRYQKALELVVKKVHQRKIWEITHDLLTEEEWQRIVAQANQGCCVIL
jgi:hypothetical protein